METLSFGLMALGILVTLAGWIWMVIFGFQVAGRLWGVLNIFTFGIPFCIWNKGAWKPLLLEAVGVCTVGVGVMLRVGTLFDKIS